MVKMFNKKKVDINKINEKYGALIEDLDFMMIFGACDRLLPYPKQDIENALLAQAIHYKATGDQKVLNTIISCYLHLSIFVSYEKYNVVKMFYGPNGLNELRKQSEETKERFFKIQDEILTDMKERVEKINTLLGIVVAKLPPKDAVSTVLLKDYID